MSDDGRSIEIKAGSNWYMYNLEGNTWNLRKTLNVDDVSSISNGDYITASGDTIQLYSMSDDLCTDCESGLYSDASSIGSDPNSCVTCPTGFFQDETGQSLCKQCDTGQYQDVTSQTSCKSCPEGQYQNQHGQFACEPW